MNVIIFHIHKLSLVFYHWNCTFVACFSKRNLYVGGFLEYLANARGSWFLWKWQPPPSFGQSVGIYFGWRMLLVFIYHLKWVGLKCELFALQIVPIANFLIILELIWISYSLSKRVLYIFSKLSKDHIDPTNYVLLCLE